MKKQPSVNTSTLLKHIRETDYNLRGLLILVSAMFCLYGPAAMSDGQTHQVKLSEHDFETWSFEPAPQDKIEITNSSELSHSIYITYPDGTVINLGVQIPGEKVSWTVPGTGEYILQCWIHPVIKASLMVQKPASIS